MRLVLCDDNRILCEALAAVLESHGHRVVAIATCAADGIAAVSAYRPDACLLDLRLPDGDGLETARTMGRCHPDTKVVVLSCLTDPSTVAKARRIGVAGFLRKDQSPVSIAAALNVVAGGGVAFDAKTALRPGRAAAPSGPPPLGTLTPRETEVLRRIVAGQSTRQMASEMNVSVSTLRSYVKNILAKLGAHSRLQAAAIASGRQYPSVA